MKVKDNPQQASSQLKHNYTLLNLLAIITLGRKYVYSSVPMVFLL